MFLRRLEGSKGERIRYARGVTILMNQSTKPLPLTLGTTRRMSAERTTFGGVLLAGMRCKRRSLWRATANTLWPWTSHGR